MVEFTLSEMEQGRILDVLNHLATPNRAADAILKRAGDIAKRKGKKRREVINAILSDPVITAHPNLQKKIVFFLNNPRKISMSRSNRDKKATRERGRIPTKKTRRRRGRR